MTFKKYYAQAEKQLESTEPVEIEETPEIEDPELGTPHELDDEVDIETDLPESENLEPEFTDHEVVEHEQPQISLETKLLLEAFNKLIDRIDQLAASTPVINVPAPIVEVSIPETRKVVNKIVERDENGLITQITEDVQEHPTPLNEEKK